TYMNLSGEAVRDLLGYFRTPREGDLADQLIVVHDDLDLPLGKWRFRKQGSAGGHRGVASIIQCLGHDRFGRLKVGIGRPREGTEAADYVLETISASERETIDRLVREAARMLSVWLESGIETCMNRFNHASLDLGSEEGDAESGSSRSHRGAPPPANRSAADRDPI
ncbi:MAG TPA: aminoacyl-tRNA hydrolase, partial [Planctomycetota bacterium]|nr:aminoacyl-tRNA hydrolase [Planctomycetota bacterium]